MNFITLQINVNKTSNLKDNHIKRKTIYNENEGLIIRTKEDEPWTWSRKLVALILFLIINVLVASFSKRSWIWSLTGRSHLSVVILTYQHNARTPQQEVRPCQREKSSVVTAVRKFTSREFEVISPASVRSYADLRWLSAKPRPSRSRGRATQQVEW
jgi:hypothetical protein